jgi:hypothetical protein
MLRKSHRTNFFHIKFLTRNNIKCQNGPVVRQHKFFYFNSQALHRNTQTQYKQTCSCTQMFALCGNRTCDLLRSSEYSHLYAKSAVNCFSIKVLFLCDADVATHQHRAAGQHQNSFYLEYMIENRRSFGIQL